MLELCTASRLHFGLLELAAGQPHRFGGLGLMVETPQLRVRIAEGAPAPPTKESGEIDRRVHSALEHVERMLGRCLPADCHVEVLEHPALHSGLGLGTQLAAAVTTAASLATTLFSGSSQQLATTPSRWQPVAQAPASNYRNQIRELARLSGRGKRSAIGLHGFLYGGLVQDLGYQPDSGTCEHIPAAIESRPAPTRPIATRSVTFPSAWPVVLILATEGGDMHGAAEESLITAAGATPNREQLAMLELSESCMAAADRSDFDGFVDALERYMKIAASLFESVQAGRYRDKFIAQRVASASQAGLRGVGQSSWGPTVFGFAIERASAERAADHLRSQLVQHSVQVLVTQAAKHGARWRTSLSGVQHAG